MCLFKEESAGTELSHGVEAVCSTASGKYGRSMLKRDVLQGVIEMLADTSFIWFDPRGKYLLSWE